MKGVRFVRWTGHSAPAARPCWMHHRRRALNIRLQSISSTSPSNPDIVFEDGPPALDAQLPPLSYKQNTPNPDRALSSAKLSALHARLDLPSKLPLQTLARTLVHTSADPDPNFNNYTMRILGKNLLAYYASEHLMCHYPRLPLAVVFAAMWSLLGTKALSTISREWGLEAAAEPGVEVDPGLLQFKRLTPGESPFPEEIEGTLKSREDAISARRRQGHRLIHDDEFGETPIWRTSVPRETAVTFPVSLDEASSSFVRALVGAIYLHAGRETAKTFFRSHILPRHLPLHELFSFTQPTRDLSRLCAREGFEPPVARLISETGRHSRHPVFVVGVFSGKDKLGEGFGGSLDEARLRASATALRSWYLYSPGTVRVPSDMENAMPGKTWTPAMIDIGEVVV